MAMGCISLFGTPEERMESPTLKILLGRQVNMHVKGIFCHLHKSAHIKFCWILSVCERESLSAGVKGDLLWSDLPPKEQNLCWWRKNGFAGKVTLWKKEKEHRDSVMGRQAEWQIRRGPSTQNSGKEGAHEVGVGLLRDEDYKQLDSGGPWKPGQSDFFSFPLCS